jgi:hypothetical protein
MPTKSAAKSGNKPAAKTSSKAAKKPAKKSTAKRAERSPYTAIDKSMAVVLQATGLDQLKPIRPTRKTTIRSTDNPTPR